VQTAEANKVSAQMNCTKRKSEKMRSFDADKRMTVNDSDDVISGDGHFQVVAPATRKARLLAGESLMAGTSRWSEMADLGSVATWSTVDDEYIAVQSHREELNTSSQLSRNVVRSGTHSWPMRLMTSSAYDQLRMAWLENKPCSRRPPGS
jgi:hypothetical protein